jgi:hypothetical protein
VGLEWWRGRGSGFGMVARACGAGRPSPLSQPLILMLVEQCDRAQWLTSRAPLDTYVRRRSRSLGACNVPLLLVKQ